MADPAPDQGLNEPLGLSNLITQLPDPCALVDERGVLQAVNEAWRDMFYHTGLGAKLDEVCATLFHWEADTWPPVADELQDLLAGNLPRLSFEAMLADPPERWGSCSLAALPTGGYVWQLADVTRWQLAEAEASKLWQHFREATESLSDGFAFFDASDKLVFCNRHFRTIYARIADQLVPGRSYADLVRLAVRQGQFAPAADGEEALVAELMASHQSAAAVEQELADGRRIYALDRPMPGGGIVGIRTDVTELRRAEELRRQTAEQEATIKAQAVLLAELSTPVMRIGAGALMMPLVGSIDSLRAGRAVEALLRSVAEQQAVLVLLDITGVPVVDTQVANVLVQTARAVRLLGANLVLTGIRPDVAQTMVALGVDLGDMITRADLAEGIAYALRGR